MDRNQFQNHLRTVVHSQVGIAILLLCLLGMMTLPMPVFLLDIFFTFNIAFAIVILWLLFMQCAHSTLQFFLQSC